MPRLVLAAGTPYEVSVQDVRAQGPWADPQWTIDPAPHRVFVVHHTGERFTEHQVGPELRYLRRLRDVPPFGLPYNFVVMARWPFRIYYLTGYWQFYPFTYASGEDVSVALAGNYQVDVPPAAAVRQVGRLLDALREEVRNHAIPAVGHRDVYPTACPGDNLYPSLDEL